MRRVRFAPPMPALERVLIIAVLFVFALAVLLLTGLLSKALG